MQQMEMRRNTASFSHSDPVIPSLSIIAVVYNDDINYVVPYPVYPLKHIFVVPVSTVIRGIFLLCHILQ